MSDTTTTYISYATHPTAQGPQELCAKLIRPSDAPDDLPLMVWLHSGGFRSGDIENNSHTRIASNLAQHGYASAFVQYRLRARPEDLRPKAQALLPGLIADAEIHASNVNPGFVGSRALAVVEDAAAFLQWADENASAHQLNGRFIVGGSSAGAMSVLNLLSLAPRLDIKLPEIPTAFVMSGAFAHPSFFTPSNTRVLALHGTHETQIPATSIRSYAYNPAANCTLIEDAAHQHGDLRVSRKETLRNAVRRLVEFDNGAELSPGRADLPKRKTKRENRICLYASVENEGPFLLEWMAHYRAIGVTDFVIFSNDCDDGTTEILARLHETGVIRHVINPSTALGSDQHLRIATQCAPYTKEFRKSDYAILVDVDEFIQINCADGTLNGLLASMDYPDVISLSELNFGFNAVQGFENKLVTTQFRSSDALRRPKGGSRRGVKSIMRVHSGIASYGNRRPQITPEALDQIIWVDGAGQPVPEDFITLGKRGMPVTGRYALARLNHYALRSGESMLVTLQQMNTGRSEPLTEKSFKDRNGRALQNDGMRPHLPALKTKLNALLQDPDLLRLHHQSVAKHRAKIARLKGDPDYAKLWAAIKIDIARARILEKARKTAAE